VSAGRGRQPPGPRRRARARLADAGINIAFLVAQVVGRRFTATFGFGDEATAATAMRVIKAAAAPPKKAKPTRRRR